MKITADEIINIYYDARPRYLWKLDQDTYNQIKRMKDANSEYLWTPNLDYEEKPGNLVGIEIVIVKKPSCKLALIYSDSTELICRESL